MASSNHLRVLLDSNWAGAQHLASLIASGALLEYENERIDLVLLNSGGGKLGESLTLLLASDLQDCAYDRLASVTVAARGSGDDDVALSSADVAFFFDSDAAIEYAKRFGACKFLSLEADTESNSRRDDDRPMTERSRWQLVDRNLLRGAVSPPPRRTVGAASIALTALNKAREWIKHGDALFAVKSSL
jgi:hypothetical protein